MKSSASKTPWVDSHFHVFSAGQGRLGARYIPAYDASLYDWLAAAGSAGVRRGVLVQTSFLGTDNTRLRLELREHPEVLRGIAVIDPETPAQEMRRLHADGVRGIRLNLSGISHDLAAWNRAPQLWDEIGRLGWHVELHTDVGALPTVMGQIPVGIHVVVDHMAKPDRPSADDLTVACLRARSRVSGVHVKLSGAYRLGGRDAKAIAQMLQAELGNDRLLWGSDWPCTNHEECADYGRLLSDLWDWVGDEGAASALGSNPHALYWADDALPAGDPELVVTR